MAPDKDIVFDRIRRISENLLKIDQLMQIPEDEFLKNFERHNAVLHLLQITIEAALDIALHICTYDNFGTANSYAEAFDILSHAKIIDKELGLKLREAAKFRNKIVHLYHQVDLSTVYEIAKNKTSDFSDFIKKINEYMGS